MRIFIGIKYRAGESDFRHVPVMYGDPSRQVANIIRENSENKLISVPKISCYINGLAMDRSRSSDATFVSKMHIRERAWSEVDGSIEYENFQGGAYTVERLMPTPYKLTMNADIWCSNTDQKLQILEQILMLFNPSLEIQTTDNYIDWTSLSVVELQSDITFTGRSIPQGAESTIDVCTLRFEMPIYISPPAKVKKLGVIKNIIMNIFDNMGDYSEDITSIVYGNSDNSLRVTPGNFGVLLLKANNGQPNDYNVSVVDYNEAVTELGLDLPEKQGPRLNWNVVFSLYERYHPGISEIFFLQPGGSEVVGTFVINNVDPTFMVVTIDPDSIPTNTLLPLTSIIEPQKFNPVSIYGAIADIPTGTRLLLLDKLNDLPDDFDGPTAWRNLDGTDPVADTFDIIEWDGSKWSVAFDSSEVKDIHYVTNLKTGVQYKWDGDEWLKSFEGEYGAGFWRLEF